MMPDEGRRGAAGRQEVYQVFCGRLIYSFVVVYECVDDWVLLLLYL